MRFVVVVTAGDGTKYAYGPTDNEYRATVAANTAENEETVADVIVLEPLTELKGEQS